jgi:hypothetical protein
VVGVITSGPLQINKLFVAAIWVRVQSVGLVCLEWDNVSYRNGVLPWVPTAVEDLLREINRIHRQARLLRHILSVSVTLSRHNHANVKKADLFRRLER